MKFKLVLISAIASASIGSVIASDDLETLAAKGVTQLASNSDVTSSLKNTLSNKVDDTVKAKVQEWLPNAEISIEGVSNGKPTIGILTVNPLYESEDLKDTIFNQASFYNNDDRQTLNLGLGYRRMTDDESWLLGVNAFYDHEFPYDHQRGSVGLEARSSVIEFNANKYYGISGWKTGESSLDEKALGGHDVEMGLALPYMPGSKLYHKQFTWNAENGVADLKGKTTSLAINGDVLIPGMGLEVGATDYETRSDVDFVKLTFKYPPPTKTNKLFSDVAYDFSSMKDERLNKVRRVNKIVIQKKSASGGTNTVSFR